MEDFTPRNVAKFLVVGIIAAKTTVTTKNAISDHTSFEKDAIGTQLAAGLVSWAITSQVKPYTDRAIDKIADKILERRAARKLQKEATPETE